MNDLITQLKKAVELDEHWFEAYAKDVCKDPKFETERVGLKLLEHIEKQRKLIDPLIECVTALEAILALGNLAAQGNWDDTHNMKTLAYNQLARLEKAVPRD